MRYKDFEIKPDGETVVVYKVTITEKTQEEKLTPVAYVRDVLGGIEAVLRKAGVSALEKKELKDAISIIKEQHKEMKELIKKEGKECLKV